MAATVPVATLPVPLQEKELSSPSTPSRNSDDRDVEAVTAPPVPAEPAQVVRLVHGWRWALGGELQGLDYDKLFTDGDCIQFRPSCLASSSSHSIKLSWRTLSQP